MIYAIKNWAISAGLGRTVLGNPAFFDSNDVQTRNGNAAIVIKPNNHTTPVRMNACVIRTDDAVTMTSPRDDNERLKRPCF